MVWVLFFVSCYFLLILLKNLFKSFLNFSLWTQTHYYISNYIFQHIVWVITFLFMWNLLSKGNDENRYTLTILYNNMKNGTKCNSSYA